MLRVRNNIQRILANVAQRFDVGDGPVVFPPLTPYVPPPPSGNVLYWGANDLLWGAANQLLWG